ncbi:MAG: flagellar hook-associated protein FlgK [Clostridium sp.]
MTDTCQAQLAKKGDENMSGLFSTFNVAKRGIGVSQYNIDVTSHNINNANTPGYSRQRAKIVTSRPQSVPGGVGQLGTGAQVQAIERIRDSHLDYQIRNETSTIGKYDVKNKFLYEVETIFNEPSDTGISTLLGKFFDSFQELSKQPNSSNARTVVAQQAAALCDALNATATQLEKLKTNTQDMLRADVKDMNSLLDQISQLNKEIASVESSGQAPNDLLDRRDMLLDELSYKFNIQIDNKQFGTIEVKPGDPMGMKVNNLVTQDGSEEMRFSYISSIEEDPSDPNLHIITYYKNGDMESDKNKQTIKVAGLTPTQVNDLQANRILWANSNGQAVKPDGYPIKDGDIIHAQELMMLTPTTGTVAGNVAVQKDIQSYMDQLDRIAMSMAWSVNAIHSGMPDSINPGGQPDKDYMPFFVNKDISQYNGSNQLRNLDETLFAEDKISAKNISINMEILEDPMKIKTKTNDCNYAYTTENTVDGEGDGARALAIAQLRDSLLMVQNFGVTITSRSDMFDLSKGGTTLSNNGMKIENSNSGIKIDGYFKDTIDRLGVQAQEAKRMVENQENLLGNLESTKDSISGVSLDEEMANLIQFQHAYNANAKLISTIDELLDVIVNGLKR